jgi:adenylate cyclase
MKISIRTLLTIPFLLLTLTPVGIVGWLFYSNSQKAVEQIANDLFNQISDRTSEQIQLYLSTPHLINRLNANAIELGAVNLNDRPSIERFFVKQFRSASPVSQALRTLETNDELTRSFNNIYIGTPQGIFSGAEYRPINREDTSSESESIIAISRLEDGNLVQYSADRNGDAVEKLDGERPYNLSERAWYKEGFEIWDRYRNRYNEGGIQGIQERQGWSPPYCDNTTETPAITAVLPIGEPSVSEPTGILGSDFLFSDIEGFLKNLLGRLEVEGGRIFILDSDNKVFVMATPEDSQTEKCNPDQPLKLSSASAMENSIISRLVEEFPDNNQLVEESSDNSELKRIEFKGQQYFWDFLELQDEYSLKLKIFIAIPESSFTGTIKDSTESTLILGGLTLLITTILGLLLARQIVQPVLELEKAAQGLTDSTETSPNLIINNPSELHNLARTFETMSVRLKGLLIAFRRFVPQNFLNILDVKDITEIKLGSYKRAEMTILFSDIRSFTKLSENMTPEQNFRFINSYLNQMEPAINENNGFIDKYIGDAIMALFKGKNSPDNAVKASIGMLKRLAEYNESRVTKERPPIRIGIGLHTGEITLGTLGGLNRWDTTVIGSEVNKASRVEGLTKGFSASLLVSKETLDLLQNKKQYHHRYLGLHKVRGLDEFVSIYEIYEADAPEIFEGKIRTATIFQEALRLYEMQDYTQALKKFEDVLEICPEDGAAKFYIGKCKKYLGQDSEG